MLKIFSFLKPWLSILILLALFLWTLDGSPSYRVCIQESQKTNTDAHFQEKISAISIAINIRRDCLGNFIHTNKDEIIAVFTAVLAFSTIFLWVATREQIELSRKEFISTHRPRIIILALRPHLEGETNNRYPVEFIYLNRGETDAHIKEIGTRVFLGPGPWTFGARRVGFNKIEKLNRILSGGQALAGVTAETYPKPL